MKKSLIRSAGGAVALALMFGASANANPYDTFAGQTFAKVQEVMNGNAKIASRVGEYLVTEDCIVTGSRKFNGSLWVDLNCNDPQSAGGDGNDHAGNSVMSPAGQKMAKQKRYAVIVSEDYAKAVAAGKPPMCESKYDICVTICQKTGACSAELLQYLGV